MEIKSVYTPKLLISPHLAQKLFYYVRLGEEKTGEISGLGTILPLGESKFLITDLFILKQESSGAETKLNREAIAQKMVELVAENSEKEKGPVRLWWHSHAKMGVFWSNQDEFTMKDIANDEWMFSLVVNCEHKSLARFSIYGNYNVFFDDVPFEETINKELEEQCRKEVDELVSKQVVSFGIGFNGGYGMYNNGDDDDDYGYENMYGRNLRHTLKSQGHSPQTAQPVEQNKADKNKQGSWDELVLACGACGFVMSDNKEDFNLKNVPKCPFCSLDGNNPMVMSHQMAAEKRITNRYKDSATNTIESYGHFVDMCRLFGLNPTDVIKRRNLSFPVGCVGSENSSIAKNVTYSNGQIVEYKDEYWRIQYTAWQGKNLVSVYLKHLYYPIDLEDIKVSKISAVSSIGPDDILQRSKNVYYSTLSGFNLFYQQGRVKSSSGADCFKIDGRLYDVKDFLPVLKGSILQDVIMAEDIVTLLDKDTKQYNGLYEAIVVDSTKNKYQLVRVDNGFNSGGTVLEVTNPEFKIVYRQSSFISNQLRALANKESEMMLKKNSSTKPVDDTKAEHIIKNITEIIGRLDTEVKVA